MSRGRCGIASGRPPGRGGRAHPHMKSVSPEGGGGRGGEREEK